uniref:F-box domain-containing protein n=1 Tax=Strongyloides papillosus TaxID=174720 RepID=A0A0N5CCV1_STREA
MWVGLNSPEILRGIFKHFDDFHTIEDICAKSNEFKAMYDYARPNSILKTGKHFYLHDDILYMPSQYGKLEYNVSNKLLTPILDRNDLSKWLYIEKKDFPFSDTRENCPNYSEMSKYREHYGIFLSDGFEYDPDRVNYEDIVMNAVHISIQINHQLCHDKIVDKVKTFLDNFIESPNIKGLSVTFGDNIIVTSICKERLIRLLSSISRKIEILTLIYNGSHDMQDMFDAACKPFAELKALFIRSDGKYNGKGCIRFESIKHLKSLELISISGSYIFDLIMRSILEMSSIKCIHIDYSSLCKYTSLMAESDLSRTNKIIMSLINRRDFPVMKYSFKIVSNRHWGKNVYHDLSISCLQTIDVVQKYFSYLDQE